MTNGGAEYVYNIGVKLMRWLNSKESQFNPQEPRGENKPILKLVASTCVL